MPHLQTFARLHVADTNDVTTLSELEASLRGDGGVPDRNWLSDAANRDGHIVIAMECQAAVGAAEVVHPPNSAVATLVWLGVAHSARGRGIGQLLVESVIEHSRGEGAAVLRLGSLALSPAALRLLTASGFVERSYEETQVVIEKSLWDERSARQKRASTPHFYGSHSTHGTSAAALMVAMATIDSRFMLTPQVERVIDAEIDHERGADGQILPGMARAAARRSFNVAIRCALPPLLAQHRALGDGTVLGSTKIPTAEELIGLLSRRQIPLLTARIERLQVDGRHDDWLVVLSFDGLLFQVFDPRRPDQRDQAMTLAEMRQALAEKRATCLVISRN